MVQRQSAGIVLFRRASAGGDRVEVLLAHPGGPFFANRDEGHWTIPKGEPDELDIDLLAVARREFAEEVGHAAPMAQPAGGPPIELGSIVQKGGKIVHAWAIEGDLDPPAAGPNAAPSTAVTELWRVKNCGLRPVRSGSSGTCSPRP